MSEIKCSNENPTKLEKYLFKMYGLYPIYKHDDSRTYAPIHVDHDDTYPLSVEIDEEDIEWDEKIVFAISSGVVWLNWMRNIMKTTKYEIRKSLEEIPGIFIYEKPKVKNSIIFVIREYRKEKCT